MKRRLLKTGDIISKPTQTVLWPKNWSTGWLSTKRLPTERRRLNSCRNWQTGASSTTVSEVAVRVTGEVKGYILYSRLEPTRLGNKTFSFNCLLCTFPQLHFLPPSKRHLGLFPWASLYFSFLYMHLLATYHFILNVLNHYGNARLFSCSLFPCSWGDTPTWIVYLLLSHSRRCARRV